MAEVIVTTIAAELRYSDDSGVEVAVRYDANDFDGGIEFERVNTVNFPLDKMDWLIARLTRIRDITKEPGR